MTGKSENLPQYIVHAKANLFSFLILDSENPNFHSGQAIHGRHPLHLIEKITRERIQASLYWKEKCYGLSGRQ